MTKKTIALLAGAATVISGLLWWRRKTTTEHLTVWNPEYDKLGRMSEEWLCSQKRNPER